LRRLLYRERPQQSRVDQTKDRSVRAYAERHGYDGKYGKAALFHKLAKAKADILQKCFHKPREVLQVRCGGRTLWIQKIRRANSLAREKDPGA
jgi:hypothetical protein